MWFWSGEKVPKGTVTDIPAYNKAHSRLFLLYSLPWWLGRLLGLAHPLAAAIVAVLACTAGLAWLIWSHGNIEKRYRKQ